MLLLSFQGAIACAETIVRSERLLMEQLQYNLLFRWFVGLDMDDPVWTPTTFSKNRDRLLDGDIARAFFEDIVGQAGTWAAAAVRRALHGRWHVVGAWAGQKSVHRKGESRTPPDNPGNPTVDFHGERRLNDTHQSTTDPDARLGRRPRQLAVPLHRSGLQLGAIAQFAAARRLTRREATIESPPADYLTIERNLRQTWKIHAVTFQQPARSSAASQVLCQHAGAEN